MSEVTLAYGRLVVSAIVSMSFCERVKMNDNSVTWYCHIGDVEYGPMRFQHLQRLVAHRCLEISPVDRVKNGEDGEWQPVSSIPPLMNAAGHYDKMIGTVCETVATPPANISSKIQPSKFWQWFELSQNWNTPFWILDVFDFVTRFVKLAFKYIGLISIIGIWGTVNFVTIFYPTTSHDICVSLLKLLTSPVCWLGIIAGLAYAGAIFLRIRDS